MDNKNTDLRGYLAVAGILSVVIGIRIANLYKILLGLYDYHTGDTYKHRNSNLFRRLDKDNITSQSLLFLLLLVQVIYVVIRMVCEKAGGKQRG